MTFAYPYLFIAPLIVGALFLLNRTARTGVLFPSLTAVLAVPHSLRALARTPILGLLSAVTVIALSAAAARPQETSAMAGDQERRNLLLALDLSMSMSTEDFGSGRGFISRVEGVKLVVDDFLLHRPNDRIGLVVFGAGAFVQAPLTNDHELVRALVSKLSAGIAGNDTAIGDGLGLSLKRLSDLPQGSKAVILLTDGADNASKLNPLRAAEVARELHVKVHTIGIGDADEATLKAIAETTGGNFASAADVESLRAVYDRIDELEQTEALEHSHLILHELFVPFAWVAFAAYLLYLLAASTLFVKVP